MILERLGYQIAAGRVLCETTRYVKRLPPSTRSASATGCQESRCTGMPAFTE